MRTRTHIRYNDTCGQLKTRKAINEVVVTISAWAEYIDQLDADLSNRWVIDATVCDDVAEINLHYVARSANIADATRRGELQNKLGAIDKSLGDESPDTWEYIDHKTYHVCDCPPNHCTCSNSVIKDRLDELKQGYAI